MRLGVLVIAFVCVATSLADAAQQAGKVWRIGFLGTTSYSAISFRLDEFRKGLRELGWIEGQNIVIEYRFAEGRLDRLPDLAAELVRLKVDIIVAHSTPGATAAKNATNTIPIVMTVVGDPVGLGLIASLARPGGNATGLSFSVVERRERRGPVVGSAASTPGGPRSQRVRQRIRGDGQRARGSTPRSGRFDVRLPPNTARRPRSKEPPAGSIWLEGACGGRGPHVLRTEPARSLPASCHLRG